MTDINVTPGTGKTVSTETISGSEYQRIKVIDGTASGTTGLKVNSDGSINTNFGNSSVISLSQSSMLVVQPTGANLQVGASIVGLTPFNLTQIQGGGVNIVGNGVTGTNTLRVTIASDSTGAIGTRSSIVGAYSEDSGHATADVGVFTLGVRNDTMSSVTSADVDYSPFSVGPIGELIVGNAPITKWVQSQTSIMYGTSVQVLAAQGASVFTYITAVQIVNDCATMSRVKFTGGLGSVLGWTVAPASGGSNIVFPNGLKTGANSGFSASISGVSSVYLSIQGFISNT